MNMVIAIIIIKAPPSVSFVLEDLPIYLSDRP